MKDNHLSKFFSTSCSCFGSNGEHDLDIVLDFLRILHQPPPSDVGDLQSFSVYLWEYAVNRLGFSRGASRVSVVIDKPQFLPPPRAIVHKKRQNSLGITSEQLSSVDTPLPDQLVTFR